MLMITVTAFATSYADKLTYKLTVFTALTKDLPAGELTIEPYGTSNYTVTAKGCDLSDFDAGNWDEIVCEDVAGTTDANGVTTITLDNPYAYRTSDNTSFLSTKLVVKFNGTKAYAHFEGKVKIGLATRAFEYTFGTDEGFESTGGGSTGGGEDKPAIVDVVDADYAPNGAAFGFQFTINWETQKLVAKLDLSTCSRYTHNEGIITVGTDNGNGDVSLWEPKSGEANCHLYYTRYYYGTDEKLLNLHYLENPSGKVNRVDNSIQNLEPGLVVFTFDKNGLHVGDNLIATPDQMSTLYNSTSLIFGSKEGSTRSNATYKYVKVVPADWTETTEPEVTEVSNKTYTSNLRILDGKTTVVEEAEANVNIVKYSDESYKVTLKNVNMLNKTQDLVFVGTAIVEEGPAEGAQPLTIMAKSDEATTTVFGEQVNGTFEITEVSAEEIKMGFVLNNTSLEYQGEFNYTEEETPEVYTSNLHIYDAAAPETDLFQADQAKVEFLATATGGFKLTLKDVTLNEKTQDLVFTGTLPTPQPGGQDPLAEEGETTPAEPAMVLNATADEATTRFFGGSGTYATAVFNVSYDKNDNFMMTFTITAGAKNYGGEFNYVKKTPETPDPELFCKENYVADGEGFEWEIAVDWETQKIVMSIDPSTCTGSCEHVIGLGASPTTFHGNLHLYRTNDQQLQGYFETAAGNNNTGKFAETAPFLVEVSKAQGFVVNNEVKIASSAMSDLFTLSTVKMGTGEGVNDKSRATYNYVKVVDKDWTAPKDPDTGINATTVAEGEVEFFTVNGVKLNKLQKGLNIVRTADGKVKKVLVK